jgi:hypothetical protein
MQTTVLTGISAAPFGQSKQHQENTLNYAMTAHFTIHHSISFNQDTGRIATSNSAGQLKNHGSILDTATDFPLF